MEFFLNICELDSMASTDSPATQAALSAAHLEDLKLAASKMLGAERRAFQAEMALRYCDASARKAELVFGMPLSLLNCSLEIIVVSCKSELN